jgi:hypothetical protein
LLLAFSSSGSSSKADNHQDLLAELWFYRLAHCPDYRQQAIKQLDVLLKKGAKSIGWDFSANIERAYWRSQPIVGRLELDKKD